MDFSWTEALVGFYTNLDIYIIILARMAGFIIIVPGLNGPQIPMPVKVFFAFFIALLIGTAGDFSDLPDYAGNTFAYAGVIASEFMTGFLIGFAIYLFMTVMFIVGQLVDYQMGFAMVSVFDPVMQVQVPITGNLYYLVITALLVQLGFLNHFIAQMMLSYDAVPIGTAFIIGNQELLLGLVMQATHYFVLGMGIAIPVVGVMLALDVIIGIIVKAVPQMNMFVVGIPVKVLVGMVVIFVTLPLMGEIFDVLIERAAYLSRDIIFLLGQGD